MIFVKSSRYAKRLRDLTAVTTIDMAGKVRMYLR